MGFSLFLVETTVFTVLQISCVFCLQSDFVFQLSKVLCFVPEKHMLSATRLWQKRRFRSNGTQKRIWSTLKFMSHKTMQMHECPRKKIPSVANAVVLLSWKRDEGSALGQETGAIVPRVFVVPSTTLTASKLQSSQPARFTAAFPSVGGS